MGTRICKIVEEMAEIIKPKVGNPKNSVSRNWAILSYPWNLIFLRMRFSNFFLNYMVWKYQNEIAPIFYYGISTKTNEKDIKIPKLQPPDWKSPYWMSLYKWEGCKMPAFNVYFTGISLSIMCFINGFRSFSSSLWSIKVKLKPLLSVPRK